MKIPVATAIHVITAVATATTLVVAYAWVSVYLLANIDPKFGATGTVQLYGLIAVLSSGAAVIGSGLFHFFWLRRLSAPNFAPTFWSGAVVGGLLAVVHQPFLFNMPILPGIRDWQQQCLYFVVLGYFLHWIAVPLLHMVGAQQVAAADHPKTGAG